MVATTEVAVADAAASVATTRTCKTCEAEQPVASYYVRSDGLLDLHCKACFKARQRVYEKKKRLGQGMRPRWRAVPIWFGGCEFMRCSSCDQWVQTSRFYDDASAPGGKDSSCAECVKASVRAHHRNTYVPRPRRPGRTPEERRAANRERLRLLAREHPERIQMYDHARRARELNAPLRDLTVKQWAEIRDAYDCCAYCGASGRLTQDHMLPFTRGGSHTASNVVPACKSCNSRKRTRTPEEWAEAGGFMVNLVPHPFTAIRQET